MEVITSDRFIQTSYGDVFVRRWKTLKVEHGTPIVLFHDSLGCVELWRNFPSQLCQTTGREILAYDRIGFGRSNEANVTPSNSFISSEASAVFSELIQQLKLSDFILFGHSVGGAMAIAAAAFFKNKCKALITESAQTFVEDRTIEGIEHAKLTFSQEEQRKKLEKYHGNKFEWVLNAWIDTWLSSEFRFWNSDAELSAVECPILAIHGDSDEYGSLKHVERIQKIVGYLASAIVIKGCGHVPHKENPSIVLEGVSRFLNDLSID